ncbi:hypothetical protein ACF053_03460 [Streptomyces kanasensis]|uniref:hypothetical protein n=1 Tax=Streptomyces kanasensis TaxID=936756 RepID=UPI0036F71560
MNGPSAPEAPAADSADSAAPAVTTDSARPAAPTVTTDSARPAAPAVPGARKSAPDVLGAAPLVHRSVLDVPAGTEIIPEVRRVTAQWLHRKFDRAPLETGTHHLNGHTVLTSQALYRLDGAERALRIQLREDKHEATWRVTVAAVSPDSADEPQSVAVTLECFDNGTTALSPARPALVEQLVDVLHPRDGLAHLTTRPHEVTAADVDHLVDVLCDPDRRLPAVVAARPVQPDEVWTRRMRQLLPKCAGDASLHLLTDADAVVAFREAVGEHYRVAPGAVRTYLQDVDPAWAADAPRHRLLSGARLCDPKDTAYRLIARGVHQQALGTQLPARLRTLVFPDDRQRKQGVRRAAQDAARAHATALGKELAALKEEVTVLTELLADADQDLSEARRREDLAERTVQALQVQLHSAVEQLHQEMEDHTVALENVERAQSEARVLRQRLHGQGRHEETVVLDQAAAQPSSFEELWARIEEITHIRVTADRRTAIALDDHELARTWAAKAWQGLRSLDSYASAQRDGAISGGYYHFCRNAPVAGALIFPVKQVAMSENEATKAMWGEERVFPVPVEVDPSGRMLMEAHLKLGSKGSISPRIYFHDDSRGTTGKVVVGYIGPHLTNRKTS